MLVALAVVETIVVLVAVPIAWVNIRKLVESRRVDFYLEAESVAHQGHLELIGAPLQTLRSIYETAGITGLSDEELSALPYLFHLYVSVSRIHYFTAGGDKSVIPSTPEREEITRIWMSYLALHGDHPALKKLHSWAEDNGLYHETFPEAYAAVLNGNMDAEEAQKPSPPSDG